MLVRLGDNEDRSVADTRDRSPCRFPHHRDPEQALDLCVIGTGAVGPWLALEASRLGLDVLVLEAGAPAPGRADGVGTGSTPQSPIRGIMRRPAP